jgi:hypothetical protein
MKKTITLFILLFAFPSLRAQVTTDEFKLKLTQADSIHLVSHENDVDPLTGKSKSPFIKEDSTINTKAIKESITIGKGSALKLYNILISDWGNTIEPASCFTPHHALLIYKNGICSYIDICLGCRTYAVSADLKGLKILTDQDSWKGLYTFLKQRDFHYEMPAEGKGGY